jgi:hypothetical protein
MTGTDHKAIDILTLMPHQRQNMFVAVAALSFDVDSRAGPQAGAQKGCGGTGGTWQSRGSSSGGSSMTRSTFGAQAAQGSTKISIGHARKIHAIKNLKLFFCRTGRLHVTLLTQCKSQGIGLSCSLQFLHFGPQFRHFPARHKQTPAQKGAERQQKHSGQQ